MKWLINMLNLGAAVSIVFAGAMVCNLHEVYSYSTFVDQRNRGLLAPSPKPAGHAPDPGAVEERFKSIGALDIYLPSLTYAAAALFLINAIAFFFGWGRHPAPGRPTPS